MRRVADFPKWESDKPPKLVLGKNGWETHQKKKKKVAPVAWQFAWGAESVQPLKIGPFCFKCDNAGREKAVFR